MVKIINKKITSCSECPYLACYASNSFHCLMARKKNIANESEIPQWCPLEDGFKCDRCRDTGKVDQGFADCDNIIDCQVCKGSGNIKITKQTKEAI